MDRKISSLDAVTTLLVTDELPVASSGATKKATIAQLRAAFGADGWTPDANTWVYVSATSFKVVGADVTSQFEKGTRIRLKQGGSYKYFVVTASSFSTDTTVTVTGGTDYTLANAAISDNYYSYQASPQGYPGYFNYVPTFVGFSSAPTVGDGSSRFCVNGRTCTWEHNYNTVGTSNATNFTMTLPIAAATYFRGWLKVFNNSAAVAALGLLDTNSLTVAALFTTGAGGAWTGSGTKNGQFVLVYQI